MKTNLHYVFSLAILLVGFSVSGQNKNWKKSSSNGNLNKISIRNLDAKHFEVLELDLQSFKQNLIGAPLRGTTNEISNTIVKIPNHQGNLESFRILEAPVFSPELSLKYPEIKSYVGFSIDNPGARIRMSVSPKGVQTMISYLDKPTVFMQPVNYDPGKYIVYNRLAKGDNDLGDFRCSTIDEFSKQAESNNSNNSFSRDADDQTLRTFRLAVSVNGEYTTYHGGTVPLALAAINATLTRVNEVFETDMAVNFSLVDADELIYTNAFTDPYSDNLDNWNVELQNTLTNTIGNAAYDIGHMFGASGGGGNAGCIGCVCVDDSVSTTDQNKGSGITSPADAIPEGDNFDIDYVAHEIGHQMGANHTFAFQTEGAGVNAEPGSGTTIMAYAGIVSGQNVQEHSDPYFHYHSINQILNNLNTQTCWVGTAIANNPPNANAGSNYTIPQGTAYVLKGSATDGDSSDILMYCWEQTDSGQVTSATFGSTQTSGSMNRSLSPTTSPDRYIPKWSRVMAGQLTETNPGLNDDWETVSEVPRTMSWALTVRDREATATGLNGQSSFDLTTITVEFGPAFTVTTPTTWPQATTQTVSWEVGQTDNATINCQNVNIKFSSDGGATFPTTLATNTPNDGSQTITVPSIPDSSTARILVEAADNIFYAMSTDFNVSNTPDFSIVNTSGTQSGGCDNDIVTYNFDFATVNGFSETTMFSATGNPAGTSVSFTPTSLSANGTFAVEVSGLSAAADGNSSITVTGTASFARSTDVALSVSNSLCASVANTSFETSTTGVVFNTISNLNTGKPSGYSDYTSISTDVNQDNTYDLSVNVNTDGDYRVQTKAWIDWNQNCSFDDAGEEYDLSEAINVINEPTALSPLQILIPSSASLGSTTMRIATRYTSNTAVTYPTACENGADGEVEDYTINVLTSLSVDEQELSSFAIYPNPNNGEFTVKFNSFSTKNVKVKVYDIRGRTILNNKYSNSGSFNQRINLSNVESGMYLINVSDGIKKATRKIIVN